MVKWMDGNGDFQAFSIRKDLVHHLAGTHMGPPVLIGVCLPSFGGLFRPKIEDEQVPGN